MTAERLRAMDDEALIGALRAIGPAIAWPDPTDRTPDPATRARAAIVAGTFEPLRRDVLDVWG